MSRQADTDDLENGLENQQDQMKERRMIGMRAGEELTGGDQARIGLGYEMTGDQRIGILEGTWRGKNGHQLWSWGGFEQQKSEMDGGGGGGEEGVEMIRVVVVRNGGATEIKLA